MAKDGFVSSITRQSEDFPGWYNDVVLKAELADYSPVRGCMIIRPYGYAHLGIDARRARPAHQADRPRATSTSRSSCPRSLLEKEAEHVEGFNPQVAWVTHAGGEELDEWLAIRPTSEAIIADVGEGLDPVLPRPAAAHEPLEQRRPLGAAHAPLPAHRRVPVAGGAHLPRHRGRRPPTRSPPASRATARWPRTGWPSRSSAAARARAETFPGAVYTHAIEAMMRDRKALQAGTSHMLGQNFAQGRGHRVPRPRQPCARTPTARRGASRRAWSAPRSWPTATTPAWSCRPTSAPTQLVDRAHLPDRGGPGRGRGRHRAPGGVAGRRPDRVRAAAPQGRLARGVAGLQVQPLGAARRAVPARDRAARRRRRPGRARAPPRPRQGDRAARRAGRRAAGAAWPPTRRTLFQRALDFRAANTHDVDTYDDFKADRSTARAAS